MWPALKRAIKAKYAGVSWQSPVFIRVLPVLDLGDAALRRLQGLSDLPRDSHRIRSNGVEQQFGGRTFAGTGAQLAVLLQRLADAAPDTRVLEVGCGCGRIALALKDYLRPGGYTGIDVDAVSVRAFAANPALAAAGFKVLTADVASDLYNPGGVTPAADYRFPFEDGSFDLIVLVSVFTHMFPDEVENYIKEFGRLLSPGGRLFLTVFLTDFGLGNVELSFPHDHGSYRLHQPRLPRKAVAYRLEFFDTACSGRAMGRRGRPDLGTWRADPGTVSDTGYSQDILVYRRS